MIACVEEETDELILSGGAVPACTASGISSPEDVSVSSLPSVFEGCFSVPLIDLSNELNLSASDLVNVDTDVLFNEKCLQVSTPNNLDFLVGAAVRNQVSSTDVAGDYRLPIPSAIDLPNVPGAPLPDAIAVSVSAGTTLLVGKVTQFRDKRLLKLVNIATVKIEYGQQYLETLSAVAKEKMSDAMGVGGPGLYAIYMSKKPIGFVSGKISLNDAASDNSLIIATSAPFISFSNEQGEYTIASLQGQAGINALDLDSGAFGEVYFPLETPGDINPKTNTTVESPATSQPLDDLDTLNLVGVNIQLNPVEVLVHSEDNMDFETGNITPWQAKGNIAILTDNLQKFFPDSPEQSYAFLSTGQGALSDRASRLVRDITVPKGASKLKVNYNFLSQEYPAWVDTPYNDMFFIFIAGRSNYLHHETVNNNSGQWQDLYTPLGNVDKSFATDGNVHGVFGGQVGKRSVEYDISECAGENIRLVFGVSDIGDSSFDSAALIDRIGFE